MNSSTSPIITKLLGWIPNWVGFGIIIVVGVLAIIFGATTPSAGLIAFGVAAIISSILAWYTGAKSTPDVFNGSFGATVSNLQAWVWLVVFGLFVVVVIIAIAVH